MSRKRIHVHLAQFPSRVGEPLKTLKDLKKLLQGHKVSRGDWILLPEMWASPYLPEDRDRQRMEQAFCFYILKNFAREKSCYLTGSMLEMPRRDAYNSAFVIQPTGELLARYRKIHLPPFMEEDRRYRPGHRIQVTPWKRSPFGLAICYDLRFPEQFRKMAKLGAQWIIVPSAWPRERLGHFRTLLQARAIENQCFILTANKCGKDKRGIVFGGHSMVLNPWGDILGEMGPKQGILRISIDLGQVTTLRKKYPFLPF